MGNWEREAECYGDRVSGLGQQMGLFWGPWDAGKQRFPPPPVLLDILCGQWGLAWSMASHSPATRSAVPAAPPTILLRPPLSPALLVHPFPLSLHPCADTSDSCPFTKEKGLR